MVNGMRVLNPGSTGLPKRTREASWMVIDADEGGVRVEHRRVPFDTEAVVADLHARRHPCANFVESILRGTHPFAN